MVSTLARQARDLGSIPSTCLMFFNFSFFNMKLYISEKAKRSEVRAVSLVSDVS